MWNRSAGNPAGVKGRTEATRGGISHDETGHKGESHATPGAHREWQASDV